MKKRVVLSLAVAAMLAVTGCGEDTKKAAGEAANKVTETANKAVEATKEGAAKAAEATKEAANKAVEATKEAAAKGAEAAKETAAAATQKAKETAQKAVEAAKEGAKEIAKKAEETATKAKEAAAAAADKAKEAVSGGNEKGKAVYAKCVSCHGANAEKQALGKSEVIKGWDAAKVEEALNGYKAGTRNVHGMGMLMKGQVSSLSDEDIKAVAAYISSLK